MKLPRIVWLRWAGPEKDFDRLLVDCVAGDPGLLALIEAAEIEGATASTTGTNKEAGHGKAL